MDEVPLNLAEIDPEAIANKINMVLPRGSRYSALGAEILHGR